MSGAAALGRRGLVLGTLLAAALLLLVPALINGRPGVFPDSRGAFLIGQQAAGMVGLAPRDAGAAGFTAARQGRGAGQADPRLAYTQAGARSPYYGVYLFATVALGSPWLTAALQALIAAALLALLVRVVRRRFDVVVFAAAAVALALGSSLSIFAGFISPDVFAGFAVLSVLLLTFWGDRLNRWEAAALFLLLAGALTFHLSNPMDAAGLVLVVLALRALRLTGDAPALKGAAMAAAAIGLALLAGGVYGVAVKRVAGVELSRPPFLSARLLADGAGRAYLRRVCVGAAPYALCRFAGLPLTDINTILWSTDPAQGVFEPSDYETRMKLAREEPRFVVGVVLAEPWDSLRGAVGNAWRELFNIDAFDTQLDPDGFIQGAAAASFRRLVANSEGCGPASTACAPRLPLGAVNAVLRSGMAVSAIYVALALAGAANRRGGWKLPTPSPRLTAALLAVVAILVINACICGALAGVFPRYQMRLAWLLPAFAVMVAAEGRR